MDATPLISAVERFADRLRAASQSRLERGAAAEGLALARELAARAQRFETPGGEVRELPDAGMFAVADQVAVAGRDLALVIPSDTEVADAVELIETSAARAKI